MFRRRCVLVLLLAACHRSGSTGASAEALATLTDAAGAPELTLRREGGAIHFHARDGRDGVLRASPGATVIEGDAQATRAARRPDGALVLERVQSPALELRRESTGLRLGDAQGIPLGRIRLEGAEALLFDAGGRVLVRARLEGGRMLMRDREGAVAGYATGVTSPERAALAHHPALSPGERAVLLETPDLP